MEKHYISANELLLDSFKLAELIFKSGFKPDFIVGVWRGGTPVGIAVQEYLEFMGIHADHIAIRTSSYFGIAQQDVDVRVYGLNYIIDNIAANKSLLIVDDVFDSGRSVRAIIKELKDKCVSNYPEVVKVACPWFKPAKNITEINPDFYVQATDKWLVFPHELNGLTRDEIISGKGKEIADLIVKGLDSRQG